MKVIEKQHVTRYTIELDPDEDNLFCYYNELQGFCITNRAENHEPSAVVTLKGLTREQLANLIKQATDLLAR